MPRDVELVLAGVALEIGLQHRRRRIAHLLRLAGLPWRSREVLQRDGVWAAKRRFEHGHKHLHHFEVPEQLLPLLHLLPPREEEPTQLLECVDRLAVHRDGKLVLRRLLSDTNVLSQHRDHPVDKVDVEDLVGGDVVGDKRVVKQPLLGDAELLQRSRVPLNLVHPVGERRELLPKI